MKKIIKFGLSFLLALLVLVGARSVSALTRSELATTLAITVEEGLSAEEYYTLGQQYENGDGVVRWYAKALAYYQAAQAAGSNKASTAIANLDTYKNSVLADGDQGAIFTFYRTGVTASQKGDYEQAFAIYYDDSFFFEDPQDRGLGGLADLYLAGNGVKQDVSSAIAIYQVMAEEQGKGNGYTALGNIYAAETGTYPGVSQSNDTALKYYLLSFQGENLTSTDFKGPRYAANFYDTGFYHDDGTWEEPNYVLAEQYYLIAVAGNGRTFDGTAAYKLGTYSEYGRDGVAQDYAKAVYYYEKALSDSNVHSTMLGIPDTYLALGRFYENGLGVDVNLKKALAYYYKAQTAAQDNLDLGGNVAGYEAALKVYEEASAAITRLTTNGEESSEEEFLTLTDSTTGISVTAKASLLGNAVSIKVTPTSDSSLADLTYQAYDITLQDAQGNLVQPSGAVQVTVPKTQEVDKVYHVADDHSLTSYDFSQDDNSVTFETDHFSVYALIYKTEENSTNTLSSTSDNKSQDSSNSKTSNLPATGESVSLFVVGVGLILLATAMTLLLKEYLKKS